MAAPRGRADPPGDRPVAHRADRPQPRRASRSPRGSAEHRLAACIADCGSFDLFESALERMPGPLASGLRAGKHGATVTAGRILGFLAGKPTAGWALRRGQLVTA